MINLNWATRSATTVVEFEAVTGSRRPTSSKGVYYATDGLVLFKDWDFTVVGG